MILVICALYSFLGNSSLLGPSVYLEIYAEEFGITVPKASNVISYPNLAYGFGELYIKKSDVADNLGSLILVPCYLKFGRRPVMLFSLLAVSSPTRKTTSTDYLVRTRSHRFVSS